MHMTAPVLTVARSELILGGQRSGKSRRAELLARAWLAAAPQHRAVLLATGQAWDEEMRQRIARHRHDRALRVPRLRTVEEPLALAQKITELSHPDTLLLVDCLTLWLTNWLAPMAPATGTSASAAPPAVAPVDALLQALANAPGPLLLVSNEIGLGVIPLGAEVRSFVDDLGRLNQEVAALCQRVTLMAAGLPLVLKELP